MESLFLIVHSWHGSPRSRSPAARGRAQPPSPDSVSATAGSTRRRRRTHHRFPTSSSAGPRRDRGHPAAGDRDPAGRDPLLRRREDRYGVHHRERHEAADPVHLGQCLPGRRGGAHRPRVSPRLREERPGIRVLYRRRSLHSRRFVAKHPHLAVPQERRRSERHRPRPQGDLVHRSPPVPRAQRRHIAVRIGRHALHRGRRRRLPLRRRRQLAHPDHAPVQDPPHRRRSRRSVRCAGR